MCPDAVRFVNYKLADVRTSRFTIKNITVNITIENKYLLSAI